MVALPLAAGFVVRREVAEERVAGLQVAAGDHQAQAVAGAEQRRGGAERDDDLDLLVVLNRLQGAEGVFGLVRGAAFEVEFAQGQAQPALGDAVAAVAVGAVERDRRAVGPLLDADEQPRVVGAGDRDLQSQRSSGR